MLKKYIFLLFLLFLIIYDITLILFVYDPIPSFGWNFFDSIYTDKILSYIYCPIFLLLDFNTAMEISYIITILFIYIFIRVFKLYKNMWKFLLFILYLLFIYIYIALFIYNGNFFLISENIFIYIGGEFGQFKIAGVNVLILSPLILFHILLYSAFYKLHNEKYKLIINKYYLLYILILYFMIINIFNILYSKYTYGNYFDPVPCINWPRLKRKLELKNWYNKNIDKNDNQIEKYE